VAKRGSGEAAGKYDEVFREVALEFGLSTERASQDGLQNQVNSSLAIEAQVVALDAKATGERT
jgi:hypothetical protein